MAPYHYSHSVARGDWFSKYAKFSEKLPFLTPLIRKRSCVYQRVRNVSFSKNFAYVQNEWSPSQISKNEVNIHHIHFQGSD